MKKNIIFLGILCAFLTASSQEDSLLFDLGDDDLFSMKVKSASGIDESYLDAPASMVVITQKDIRDRGYTSIDELLMDIPGFDVNVNNGTSYINAYQRGYRTPFTQRTLIMVNGKVDNHLWTHMANFSRQYPILNIDKVEVLYGPASAVYGPNAFLGVVNIITKSGKSLDVGETQFSSSAQIGSNNTHSADIYSAGKTEKLSYSLGIKMFKSDEEDLSGRHHFISNDIYGDEKIWGPILTTSNSGSDYGEYNDPTDNWGFNGEINFGNFTIGTNNWVRKEGYGPYYAADKGQNADTWNYSSNQIYIDHSGKVNDKFTVNTSVNYRKNRVWGKWTEATPMWDETIHTFPGDTLTLTSLGVDPTTYAHYSFVSSSNWNSINDALRINQNYELIINDNFHLNGGVKFERKLLTKAYDIPGYWGVTSSIAGQEIGMHGYGTAVQHSLDPTYVQGNLPASEMPVENLILTEDFGGFVQAIYDYKSFRFQGGLRYDINSLYGESFNPRVSAIYKLPKENGAIKVSYAEAFQEPAPIQLFGGWSGRSANPDLKPEKARNLEIIGMYQKGKTFQQISIYNGRYENVIKEEAENAGERSVFGVEYSINTKFSNPLDKRKISVYGYYTFTSTQSSVSYDFTSGAWVEKEDIVGDIAPHKVQLGVNLPFKNRFNLNLRGQYISERTPYLRNQLRSEDYVFPSYFNLDANFSIKIQKMTLALKVKNVLNAQYFYPGPEGASAGLSDESRSLGFQNSLIPNASRNFLASLNFDF